MLAEIQRSSGCIETRPISIELHHRDIPQRAGSQTAHEPWNLEEVYPRSHEGMDPHRHTGYDLKKIKQGTNSYYGK